MTHRQETATGTEQQDRETPENAVSGSLSAPHDENGAEGAEAPERATGGRLAPRGPTASDATIRRQLEQILALRETIIQQRAAIDRVRAFAEDMRTWCSPHGIAADYADRLLAVLEPPDNQPADGAR
ncbi:hypothetical protein [Streptomyces noursei]|uniref:hypothetical protein n=1 Tax=Streptomyces noursei TaxID=1971 RepID=UPI0016737EB5|nr:hypothetical protein [Streptomyces noursei]MCZ1014016.1 hypothetical protein [Streptomyces noursei]GGX49202.1 hypothetical protein GCM10010341_83560 [Streptomyces noursei]